jgi:hypothetical protein
MKQVNPYLVENLLSPFGGTADIDTEIIKYANVDNNNEELVKQIITQNIKPYYESRSDLYKEAAKRSLRYYLTTNRINYGDIYDNCLIAFDHPDEPRDFFLWIWEVLFPGEEFLIHDEENYIEIIDLNEANSYLL